LAHRDFAAPLATRIKNINAVFLNSWSTPTCRVGGAVNSWVEIFRPGIQFGFVKVIVIAVVIGLLAGLLGSLCGVGGGIVMVPAFVGLLGFAQQKAVATSLAIIVVTSLVSTMNNTFKAGHLVDWKIVALVGAASAMAAWFGTDLMRSLSNQTLTRIFGVVLVLFGARMLMKG
jgi:uncharacterized membrane protein YfcA